MTNNIVNFTIDGEEFSISDGHLSVTTSLNEFIRRHAGKRGTKYMCLEGGCGACIVNASSVDSTTGEVTHFAVNSCLVNVMGCDNWSIATVQGIGNRRIGYNVIQQRLNQFFGSQCGYCSPGMVMNMYSLLQASNGNVTAEEVENAFGSNLCRCTGYRPILEAFKSLSSNPEKKLQKKIKDIEDLSNLKCWNSKINGSCESLCSIEEKEYCMLKAGRTALSDTLEKKVQSDDDHTWYRVDSIDSLFKIYQKEGRDSYMLVAGNTGQGVQRIDFYPKVIINIAYISELKTHYLDVNLVLGAAMTLSEIITLFQDLSKQMEEFQYLDVLANHILQVGHIPVRNIGTIGGNLGLKNKFPNFASDIFVILCTVGATITIAEKATRAKEMKMTDFLKTNLQGKLITQIKLPPLANQCKVVTYRIAPKFQNAHAIVNSGFMYHFDQATNNIKSSQIVYGGIGPTFTRSYNTENYLSKRNIFTNSTLQLALRTLSEELNPNYNLGDPSPEFRKQLALALFYKSIISICPDSTLNQKYKSGATVIDRPAISTSHQDYQTTPSTYPVSEPVLKKEGLLQCSGEALYTDDVPTMQNELYAAFALASVAKGTITSIDISEAMKINGVVAVFTAKDIPGKNGIVEIDNVLWFDEENFLVDSEVQFFNQPVAIVYAENMVLARQAASLIKIKYSNVSEKVIVSIEDALNASDSDDRIKLVVSVPNTASGTETKTIIKGRFKTPYQFHYTMELQSAISLPIDDRIEVQVASQHPDLSKAVIANLLNLSQNNVRVVTRRCGGGFGSKLSRCNFAACATALGCKLLNRPCRMSIDLRDVMRGVGKRPSSVFDYEAGVNDQGVIQYLTAKHYSNHGITSNESDNGFGAGTLSSACYDMTRWSFSTYGVKTDSPTNIFMRAPGSMVVISFIEHVMDHVAHAVKIDHIKVRSNNYRTTNNALITLLPDFLTRSEYNSRKSAVEKFNSQNRWKKRGIRFANMEFPIEYVGNHSALVSINRSDGSVIITVGGVEMGQGVFTKVAQAGAYELGVPIDKVSVLPNDTYVLPNNFGSGASIVTDTSVFVTIQACKELNSRLAQLKLQNPNATWEELILSADDQGILLQSLYLASPTHPNLHNYTVNGLVVLELELDVLTGRYWIARTDILEDTGSSINPGIDIGQVEGAFIQGVSLWSTEEIILNESTGEVLTDRTWSYHIMGAKDIPHDFRVYLRRNAPNSIGVLGSKAAGEPPICLSYVLLPALTDAINASRVDSGYDISEFLFIGVPATCENIVKAVDVQTSEFLLY